MKKGSATNLSDGPQSRRRENSLPHSFQCTCWAAPDRTKSPLRPQAPHLGLVGLWTQLKNTGQPLGSEEQPQRQGPRVSVLRRILADVPLQSAERLSLTPKSSS